MPLEGNTEKRYRVWLRSKGFQAVEIAPTLAWLDEMITAGRQPRDEEILTKAEEVHASGVNLYLRQTAPAPLLVRYEGWTRVSTGAFLGSLVGQCVFYWGPKLWTLMQRFMG